MGSNFVYVFERAQLQKIQEALITTRTHFSLFIAINEQSVDWPTARDYDDQSGKFLKQSTACMMSHAVDTNA